MYKIKTIVLSAYIKVKDGFQPNISTFSMRALIWVYHKVVSQFLYHYFNKFHIEIGDDTIQYLNCVLGQIFFKHFLQLFSIFTYSYVAIYIWYFSKNAYFRFYISKELTSLWEMFYRGLSRNYKTKKSTIHLKKS